MSITDRIIELVSERGISVSALEKAVGLGNGTVGKWRKQSPSCDKLLKVANYLNTSTDYLITGKCTENTNKISYSTVGAVGEHSHGTVNIGAEEDLSESITLDIELLKIFHRLPSKEQHRLLIVAYEFEEDYLKNRKE